MARNNWRFATVNDNLRRLLISAHRMTNDICAQCTPPFHCCNSVGAKACAYSVRIAKEEFGVSLYFPKLDLGEVILTSHGCPIPPEIRPSCSLYACQETVDRIATPEWKATYLKLKETYTLLYLHKMWLRDGRAGSISLRWVSRSEIDKLIKGVDIVRKKLIVAEA